MGYGKKTGKLGYDLYEKYEDTRYEVYYSHPRDDIPNNEQPNYSNKGLVPFFSDESAVIELSYVDIVFRNTETNGIEIVIEIEESESSPKKIAGDITTAILSDKIRFKLGNEEYYDCNYDDLTFIMATKINPRGDGAKKTKLICEKLSALSDKPGKREIEIIPIVDKDVVELIDKVRTAIDNTIY